MISSYVLWGNDLAPLATQVTPPYGIMTEVVQQRAGGWFLFNQIWKMNCPADWRVNDQKLRVRKAYSVDPSMLDVGGGHLCSLCCPVDRIANCVTDKAKFRPKKFLLFSGCQTPNSTAWTHVGSFSQQVSVLWPFSGCILKISFQCINILSFFNEMLPVPLIIYCFGSVCEAGDILSLDLSFGVVLSHLTVHRAVHHNGVGRNTWSIPTLKWCYQLQLTNSSVDK